MIEMMHRLLEELMICKLEIFFITTVLDVNIVLLFNLLGLYSFPAGCQDWKTQNGCII
jgi:hypothetical protein